MNKRSQIGYAIMGIGLLLCILYIVWMGLVWDTNIKVMVTVSIGGLILACPVFDKD